MKTKETTHTPTPWHRNVSPAHKYPIYADKNGNPEGRDWIHIAAVLPGNPNEEADLDFIVRAVNSHEELLAAAKNAVSYIEGDKKQWPDEIDLQLRKAIAKAEGK